MMVKMMTKALSQIGPSENLAKVKVIARSYLSALTNCNNNVADDGFSHGTWVQQNQGPNGLDLGATHLL